MRSLFWFKEQKVQIKFLFLLRPRKEYQASTRAWDIWSLLCLKEIGWGPPAPKLKPAMRAQKKILLVVFVSLNTRSSRFS